MGSREQTEENIKLVIGDWLCGLGLRVFDETSNRCRPEWGAFEVKGVKRGKKPDLVITGTLLAAAHRLPQTYIAIEIKPGHKHRDILDGFDAVLEYFSDYLWGADYYISGNRIEVGAFVLATAFSKEGYLFKEEGKFNPHGIVRGPWDAYPMTFTIARLLWRQRDNILRRFQALTAIPKVEKHILRLRQTQSNLTPAKGFPEVGVLVARPEGAGNEVRLMLSSHPYHWHLEN